MTSQQIIFAGFGGQGILSMGKFLAYAGMDANLNVSWLPSYGPEMRGGTANCSVILTNEDIGSPIVLRADSIVVMNRPSLEKFENSVEPNGIIVMDSDLIDIMPKRNDIKIIAIPAQTIAEEIGSKKIANMILLGALVKETGIVSEAQLLESLRAHGKERFFESNKLAVEKGIEFVK
ncbi:2-oxoacid:acceptor oxidoreductase family protein [Clostridium sp. Mt-5]|uniref:2-oxoacid:acceptor oxidoreductase family protein n=1 Tax=Clostridium moutaii TaxID=3240932 RepID=A0ABV4BS77_9CLOT